MEPEHAAADQHQEPTLPSDPRGALADAGQAQVLALLRTGKQLIDAYASLDPQQQQGEAPQDTLAALQQRYVAAAAAVHATLQQCHELQAREAADAQQQQQPHAASIAALEAQAAALRAALAAKNAALKGVIDRLRVMLDAYNMWDSHQRHLLQHAAGYAAAGTGGIT